MTKYEFPAETIKYDLDRLNYKPIPSLKSLLAVTVQYNMHKQSLYVLNKMPVHENQEQIEQSWALYIDKIYGKGYKVVSERL